MVKNKELDEIVEQLHKQLHQESRLGQYIASIGTGMTRYPGITNGPPQPAIYIYLNNKKMPAACVKELRELTDKGYKGYLVKERQVAKKLPA